MRQTNPIPTPLEFKSALRIIAMVQQLRHSKNVSYAHDDDAFYLGDIDDLEEASSSSD